MTSYRKLINKRIKVLDNEIKKFDKEISGVSASMETILREKCRNIKEQTERTERFQDTMNVLTGLMTEKEFMEQRLDELEVMKAVIIDVEKQPNSK